MQVGLWRDNPLELVARVKSQIREENVINIFGKELLFRIYKGLKVKEKHELKNRQKTNYRYFMKRIQECNKHIRRCLISTFFRKIQVKTTMHFTSKRV